MLVCRKQAGCSISKKKLCHSHEGELGTKYMCRYEIYISHRYKLYEIIPIVVRFAVLNIHRYV